MPMQNSSTIRHHVSTERVHVDNGFFTAADSVLHVYLHDIQGGVLAVYNTAGSQMEQIVETYPYGMPHSSGTLSEVDVNRRWFGGKEFTAESGVNLYDFNARWLNPALTMFTTPDPLAFNTPDVSPYTFCAGDPVNYSDPTGLFRDEKEGEKYAAKYWPGCPVLTDKATGEAFISVTLKDHINENGEFTITVVRITKHIDPPPIDPDDAIKIAGGLGISLGVQNELIKFASQPAQMGKTLGAFYNISTKIARGCGYLNMFYSGYKLLDYYSKGGNEPEVYSKYLFDIGIGALSLAGGWIPLTISAAYYLVDIATDEFKKNPFKSDNEYETDKKDDEILEALH